MEPLAASTDFFTAAWQALVYGADQLWTLKLGFGQVALRLVAALVCGMLIGLEREWHHRPAGLRTHTLLALASAVFTVLAFEIYTDVQNVDQRDTVDPLRLLEAITAGVAFLAAGTIIRLGGTVTGVTTGSSLWLSGALGMACGRGAYGIAILAVVLALLVLGAFRAVDRQLHQRRQAERRPSASDEDLGKQPPK